jgi:hypothetical protein
MTTTEHLSTYLQDHRAGAEFGSDLARRLAEENRKTPYEGFLLQLAQEIDQDVQVLEDIMERLGVGKALIKTAGANIGEKIARLKLNNQLSGYSPLASCTARAEKQLAGLREHHRRAAGEAFTLM